jgi:hypothetical protein
VARCPVALRGRAADGPLLTLLIGGAYLSPVVMTR